MNGIHEVRGSIPLGSTNNFKRNQNLTRFSIATDKVLLRPSLSLIS